MVSCWFAGGSYRWLYFSLYLEYVGVCDVFSSGSMLYIFCRSFFCLAWLAALAGGQRKAGMAWRRPAAAAGMAWHLCAKVRWISSSCRSDRFYRTSSIFVQWRVHVTVRPGGRGAYRRANKKKIMAHDRTTMTWQCTGIFSIFYLFYMYVYVMYVCCVAGMALFAFI